MTSPQKRLIATMEQLQYRGINCQSCTGVCCTMARNSMRISPAETLDIVLWLKSLSQDEQDVWLQKMRACIQNFQLDRPSPGDGRRQMVRRSYTCSFFNAGPKGCALPRATKPFGCLAFNATVPRAVDDESCGSDQTGLQTILNDQPARLQHSADLMKQFDLN